jgi:thiol:disulfide interchange protein
VKVGPVRALFGIASAVFGIWCLGALNGASLGKMTAFLPPNPYPDRAAAEGSSAGVTWLRNYDEALAKAKAEGKPLFIDFTGITCTNCREMEQTVFNRPEIAEAFKNFVTVSLYTDFENDPQSERYKKMQEQRYGTVELPLYVVVSPDETKLGQISYEPNASKFLSFLKNNQGSGPVASSQR